MRIPLLDLLRDRSICHPTYIEAATFSGDNFRLTISGEPWWSEELPAPATLTIELIKISAGTLFPEDLPSGEDEALEDFSVEQAADVPWLQPDRFSIFCSEPTPHPVAVYATVDEYLHEASAFRRAGDFLNGGEVLRRFRQIASSPSYLIGSGPAPIRDLICAELTRQNVRHNIIEHDLRPETGLLVRLGLSQLVCAEAWAEFD